MDWLAVKCTMKTGEMETFLSFHMWNLLEEIVSLVPLAKEQEDVGRESIGWLGDWKMDG